jgi:hypothetical protein
VSAGPAVAEWKVIMRILLAAMAVALLLFLPGCPLGCGAYDGQGDRTFRRGDDSMILCVNGGYAATLSTGIMEGRYEVDYATGAPVFHATIGITGAPAFNLTEHTDGTASAPELGVLAWESVVLDQTDLDHADLQCLDLETRAWWTAP